MGMGTQTHTHTHQIPIPTVVGMGKPMGLPQGYNGYQGYSTHGGRPMGLTLIQSQEEVVKYWRIFIVIIYKNSDNNTAIFKFLTSFRSLYYSTKLQAIANL